MEEWRKDGRREVLIVDLEALVAQDHLLRKIEKVMDYEWIYERLAPYYCHDNGRCSCPCHSISGCCFRKERKSSKILYSSSCNSKMITRPILLSPSFYDHLQRTAKVISF